MMESIEELKGVTVIELEHGTILGSVHGMTLDPESSVIQALVYRARRGRQKYAAAREQVDKIGRDVVLLKSDVGQAIDKIEDAPGLSLQELQGCWVTTLEGKHLGTLVDIDFAPSDWKVTELELAEGKRLSVEADALKIGDDILVPIEYERRLKDVPKERYGAMGRLLGPERIDDLRNAMGRAFRRSQKSEDSEAKS